MCAVHWKTRVCYPPMLALDTTRYMHLRLKRKMHPILVWALYLTNLPVLVVNPVPMMPMRNTWALSAV